ncbi:MAG: alpha/beta hydrolase [Terracidiphilus sp.]|jgi:hypothetical protein
MESALRPSLKNQARVKVRRILGILTGVYALCLIGISAFQRSFLYYPGHTYVPLSEAHANRSFEEISVRTADGLDLKGWYAPATTKPFTFVFFHGNGDSLSTASVAADPYIAEGYGFLIAEYRGYSGLPGKPTEAGLYDDARAYIDALMARGAKSDDLILFGHSLGTGVATQMAEEFNVGGLILLAPYLSIAKMAQIKFPVFPAGFIVFDRFDNFKKIKNIHVPVLIVNGAMDQLIPPSQGKQLYDLANEPKQYLSIPNRGHNDTFDDFAPIGMDWTNHLRSAN